MRLGVIPLGFGDFGEGTGLIFLSSVSCDGSEAVLANCSGNAIGENLCNHFQDAGVICPGTCTCRDMQ